MNTVKPPNSDHIGEGTLVSSQRLVLSQRFFCNVIICDKELGKIELNIHSLIDACLVVVI